MTTVVSAAALRRHPRRILSPLRRSAPPPAGLPLLLLALLVLLSPSPKNSHNGNGRRGSAALLVSAHAPSAALFEALDADADGSISRQDWDASMATITAALGIDTHALDGGMDISNQHVAGGELGAMGRNEQAAHRDGLTGDNLVPRKQLGGNAGGTGGNNKRRKLSFTKAFTASVAMILATEIGDKTFFIAAVMSMRNDRTAVFAGAILALIVMTILR